MPPGSDRGESQGRRLEQGPLVSRGSHLLFRGDQMISQHSYRWAQPVCQSWQRRRRVDVFQPGPSLFQLTSSIVDFCDPNMIISYGSRSGLDMIQAL